MKKKQQATQATKTNIKINFVDEQNPNTWTKFEKKLCDHCFAKCCSLPVEVFALDLVRLGLLNQTEISMDLKYSEKKLRDQKWIEFFDPKRQSFILAQKGRPTGGLDCIFMDSKTRRCTVYEKRPDTCRNFPRIGPRPGFCPYAAL